MLRNQERWIVGTLSAQALLLLAVIVFRRHQRFTFTIFILSGADISDPIPMICLLNISSLAPDVYDLTLSSGTLRVSPKTFSFPVRVLGWLVKLSVSPSLEDFQRS